MEGNKKSLLENGGVTLEPQDQLTEQDLSETYTTMNKFQNDKEWQVDKFISKYKVAFSERPIPDRKTVEQWIDEMIQNVGHITYPTAGEKWSQAEWQAQYRFGKKLQSYDVDIVSYSACAATSCKKKLNCERGLLYLYMRENNIIGHTVLALTGEDNCNSFKPYCDEYVK